MNESRQGRKENDEKNFKIGVLESGVEKIEISSLSRMVVFS